MTTAQHLVDIARSYLGVRYVHQGRTPRGVDCGGLIILVCGDCGLDVPASLRTANYGPIQKGGLRKAVEDHCGVATGRQACGSIALICWPGHREPGHIAFVTGENLIHAYSRSEKVVEHGLRAPWARLIAGFYEIPGVAYG